MDSATDCHSSPTNQYADRGTSTDGHAQFDAAANEYADIGAAATDEHAHTTIANRYPCSRATDPHDGPANQYAGIANQYARTNADSDGDSHAVPISITHLADPNHYTGYVDGNCDSHDRTNRSSAHYDVNSSQYTNTNQHADA